MSQRIFGVVGAIVFSCYATVACKNISESKSITLNDREQKEESVIVSGFKIEKVCRMGETDNYFAVLHSAAHSYGVAYYSINAIRENAPSTELHILMAELSTRVVQVPSISGKSVAIQLFERSSLQREPLIKNRDVVFKEVGLQNFSFPLSIAYLSDGSSSGFLNIEDPQAPDQNTSSNCRNAGVPWSSQ